MTDREKRRDRRKAMYRKIWFDVTYPCISAGCMAAIIIVAFFLGCLTRYLLMR